MAKTVGLRAEIIINIALLVAAALLFVSFLLLRLTERELLEERLRHLHSIIAVLSRSGPLVPTENSLFNDLPKLISPNSGVIYLRLFDRNLDPLEPVVVMTDVDTDELRQVRITEEASIKVHYNSFWFPDSSTVKDVAVITIPLFEHQQVAALLQAGFSLADIRQRIASAQRIVLTYLVLYGGVLLTFGIYLLGRTVVTPIRRLMTASGRVAAGDLEQPLDFKGGPREILELADSFNTMQESLKASQAETRATIHSLEAANLNLQATQDELLRVERMASVGHLAAGMAHEIGNPLGAVIGYLELLKRDVPGGMPRDLVERAATEASRIDRLVRDLLDYAAPAGHAPETLNPVAVFAEARDLLVHQGVFDALRLNDQLPPTLPDVCIDRHRLIQVLVNFLLNARDASPPAGEICLTGGEEGDFVWLAVRDQGEGIPEEILSHLFDPFFTTKAPGKGCGLGLSVCHRIATDAGGRIEVHSTPGKGSEFILWLKKVT
ncbi:MAG: HAMP domain-containing histidine kinase, partial [Desulfuromonadales bacterium]|nr:HAMP domain-containing histidine kinase [Desulfuromonadales bacterium]